MLSDKLIAQLNDQVVAEFHSSNLYLQMAAWCDWKGLPGCAAFMAMHASEEYEHGRRLVDYIRDTGGLARIGAVVAPVTEFEGVLALFTAALDHEVAITRRINSLVKAAYAEEDFATVHFLQWFVGEQHEEEKLFRTILDRVTMIGPDGKGLYWIDKEIGKLAKKEA